MVLDLHSELVLWLWEKWEGITIKRAEASGEIDTGQWGWGGEGENKELADLRELHCDLILLRGKKIGEFVKKWKQLNLQLSNVETGENWWSCS
jgi:hypothetical protein